MKSEDFLCPKCGDEIEFDAETVGALSIAKTAHDKTCRGPEYRGQLRACPFCGSRDIDPAGWMSGVCKCPDAAAHQIMQCERRTGPACDDCGASAESIERWNTRVGDEVPL